MSKYAFVSGKTVLANVTRGLGYKLPSSYVDDVLEWIAEGLGLMQVTNTLIIQSTGEQNSPQQLNVNNHCVQLPCGFVSIIAVEDENGCRLPESDYYGDLANPSPFTSQTSPFARVASFEVNPYNHQTSTGLPTNSAGNIPPYYLDGSDIVQSSYAKGGYYKIQGNYIQTSFECGFIRVHYYAIPVDKEGYPLIPDNSNFKLGLEWHVIKRLIGSGYQHPVFKYDYAHEQCELYMARGMGEVSFYTPEGAAKLNKSFIRLIPPTAYNDEFFGIGSGSIGSGSYGSNYTR